MLLFPDRLVFDTVMLSNGITVHFYPYNVPFALSLILFPYGHKHNTGDVIPGTFHFLEHMAFRRSDAFPELFELRNKLLGKGSKLNAMTWNLFTGYELHSPTTHFTHDFSDLIDHLATLRFEDADFQKERGVIKNERLMYEKYSPGNNEISKYLLTAWRQMESSTLDERLGFDANLQKMNLAYLKNIYNRFYFTKDTVLLIGGSYDKDTLLRKLEAIPTKQSAYQPRRSDLVRWINKQYREVTFESARRPEYIFGLTVSTSNPQDEIALRCISSLAVNTATGVIYKWLRDELGETYSITNSVRRFEDSICLTIAIPLNTRAHVDALRKELLPRVRKALLDQSLVTENMKRIDAREAFSYQKLGDIFDTAMGRLMSDGRIFTETEIDAFWQKCSDARYLTTFFDTHFTPENRGEILILPKKYNRFESALVKFAKKYILRME